MALVITLIDTDGNWWDTNTSDPIAWLKVSKRNLVIEPTSTPKLSQRLRMAVKVLRRGKNAKGLTLSTGEQHE